MFSKRCDSCWVLLLPFGVHVCCVIAIERITTMLPITFSFQFFSIPFCVFFTLFITQFTWFIRMETPNPSIWSHLEMRWCSIERQNIYFTLSLTNIITIIHKIIWRCMMLEWASRIPLGFRFNISMLEISCVKLCTGYYFLDSILLLLLCFFCARNLVCFLFFSLFFSLSVVVYDQI